jgi:hypothetical protein
MLFFITFKSRPQTDLHINSFTVAAHSDIIAGNPDYKEADRED